MSSPTKAELQADNDRLQQRVQELENGGENPARTGAKLENVANPPPR